MTCEGCYDAVGSKKCGLAEEIKQQAIYGYTGQKGAAWNREAWNGYILNVGIARSLCKRPDLLDAAIRSVKPRFIGE